MKVWWDGVTRVYVDIPGSFEGNVQGLCGTISNDENDDFLTPDGDIESTPIIFANQ